MTETFKLTPERLPADEVLTYAPGIYQEMVAKQFDIRMVIMGHRVYSFALHNPLKALDWRQDAGLGNVSVEIIPTPPDIEKGILAFARKAQICFGSVDFAVDNNRQWWFLEINEQGQFLWLDPVEGRHACERQAPLTCPDPRCSLPRRFHQENMPTFCRCDQVEWRKSVEQNQNRESSVPVWLHLLEHVFPLTLPHPISKSQIRICSASIGSLRLDYVVFRVLPYHAEFIKQPFKQTAP
ncbi:MAG TPA: hypothetical protein VNW97_14195 [Candidatus Saccharimonadales bacterium]|nr:hypothetical protein [Candidatus Saccharimonadales bacterium]